jgi:hypothetical protein
MARNTTRQGAGFELTVMHDLDGCQDRPEPCKNPQHKGYNGYGYTSMRSSGSRGAVDVVAVGSAETGKALWPGKGWFISPLLFIQCKITNPVIPPYERNAVQDLATRAGAIPLVAHWATDIVTGLMRVHYRLLTGPGPKDWAHWAPGEDD